MTGRSIALFVVTAIAGTGGPYLVWEGVREARVGRSPCWEASRCGARVDRDVAALQRVRMGARRRGRRLRRRLAAWGVVFDGFAPARYDVLGSAVCLGGVAIIMYAPR